MKKLNFILMATTILGFAISSNAQAKIIHKETNSFLDVDKIVTQNEKEFRTKNVLVVFDIDNTLLTSSVDLGGDVWYQWQAGKLKIKPSKEDKVPCLYQDTIAMLYELLPMKLIEPNSPAILAKFQKRKQTLLALTSRSPNTRSATEREVKSHGFDFTKTILKNKRTKSLPMMQGKFKRDYSYIDGIMLTSGQDKGKMLSYLLNKTHNRFKSIIFVDDGDSNLKAVENTFSKKKYKNVTTTLIHYTKVLDDRIKKNGAVLTQKQADKMASDWNKLHSVINETFPDRKKGCLAK